MLGVLREGLMRTGLTVTTLTVVLAPALFAQGASRSHPFLAAGFEAGGLGATYERAYGLSLQAGYGIQVSRLGVRFGATYFQRNRSTSFGYSVRPRAVGGTLELTFDVTGSRFRPYLMGGWGVYRLSGSEGAGS